MLHKMHLNKEPFEKIWSGAKTIELRLFDEKRRKIMVGDHVEFSYIDNPRFTIEVEVVKLYRAVDFKELFDMLPLTKCGYAQDDMPDAYLHMEEYPGYNIDNQKEYGVIGIEFMEIPYRKPFRDPFRIEAFLEHFKSECLTYWNEHPDFRFGQILSNLQQELERRNINSFYFLEDEDFIKLFTEYVERRG